MTTQIVPMLPVEDLGRAVEFYQKLGFEVDQLREDWGWASLSNGDGRLMLDRSIMAASGGARRSVVYLYPQDISGFHAAARARGLEIPELETTFYGMTEFRLTDPDANQIWIGQRS